MAVSSSPQEPQMVGDKVWARAFMSFRMNERPLIMIGRQLWAGTATFGEINGASEGKIPPSIVCKKILRAKH